MRKEVEITCKKSLHFSVSWKVCKPGSEVGVFLHPWYNGSVPVMAFKKQFLTQGNCEMSSRRTIHGRIWTKRNGEFFVVVFLL